MLTIICLSQHVVDLAVLMGPAGKVGNTNPLAIPAKRNLFQVEKDKELPLESLEILVLSCIPVEAAVTRVSYLIED